MMDFRQAYNRDNFLFFLNGSDRSFLPEDFRIENEKVDYSAKYTQSVTRLGVCPSLGLDVFEVIHSSTQDARVSLSKEAFRLLLERSTKNRALVLFVPQDKKETYRFSLITIDVELDPENSKIRRSYSNPHRYSFLLGNETKVHTPTQFLINKGKVKDFEDLQKRFSVEVLTKEFYAELSDWYAWAIRRVIFPGEHSEETEDKRIEHRSKNVIRLLTRLLFVWFLKQKDLIPWQLFDEKYLNLNLIKDFSPNLQTGLFKEKSKESKYYKTILQNLFFATLNCPIIPQSKEDSRERGFRKDDWYGQNRGSDHLMRYEELFINPQLFLNLVNEKVPFLNGGLFDCLDDKANKVFIDGFSDNLDKPNNLIVPDFLFFGEVEGKGQDLSDFYGDKKKKNSDVLGLIDILKKYNFTIEENTPYDQEVSLDPELLGKVFENLLASYNPETKTTARNTTGSFYTPREIVQYMVDESLIAHLKRTVGEEYEEEYRTLMRYTDEEIFLPEDKQKEIIQSLQNCKVLDPACGSGAFPVGVLQQMVHILSQLDSNNQTWKELILENSVKELSSTLKDCTQEEREEIQADINRNFDDSVNRPDYARKLYLIENCIYGVDIQSIAVQISKLRFFISLVVDQKPNKDAKDNFGIRPLPNLEAKFVAANTLVGLTKRDMTLFDNKEIEKLQEKLIQVSHRIFGAKSNKRKNNYKIQVEELQGQIAEKLEELEVIGNEDADLMRQWRMFDQNASSKFFDPWWMFGVKTGFDIVIGNPPYGIINKKQNKSECIIVSETELLYYKKNPAYSVASGGMLNIYKLFVVKSIELLSQSGVFIEIFPLAFTGDISASKLRKHIFETCNILFIEAFPERDNPNKRVFESAKMSVCILCLYNKRANQDIKFRVNSTKNIEHFKSQSTLSKKHITIFDPANYTIPLVDSKEIDLLYKIYSNNPKLSNIGKSNTGEIDMTFCKDSFSKNPLDTVLYKGAIIDRYIIREKMSQGEIMFIEDPKLSKIKRVSPHLKESQRIVHQGITGVNEKHRLKMMIVENGYCANSVNYLSFKNEVNLKYYLGLFNSRLLNFIFSKFSTNSNVNGYEVDNLPIKLSDNQQLIIDIVDKILEIKRNNPSADTSELESQIDQIVYELYGLTKEEIKIVEGR